MAIVLALIWAALIGWLGSKRNIGFAWAFIASLFLTPIIGLIITLCSKKITTEETTSEEASSSVGEQIDASQSEISDNGAAMDSSSCEPSEGDTIAQKSVEEAN